MISRFFRSRTLLVGLCLLILVLAGGITAQAKDTWTTVRTKNFFLVGNANEKEIRQVANRLEQFRAVFAMLFPRAKFTSPVPTTVVVFKSHASYKPFKPHENIAGYFQAGEDVNYITLTAERYTDDNPYAVIFHEYVHLLIDNTMGPGVPLWFNEGLAEYYSTFDVRDNNKKVILGDLVRNHVAYLRQTRLLPLRTLFAVDSRSPYYNEGNKINMFYAQSWLLVHFLIQANKQQRLPQMSTFLNLLDANVPTEKAFSQAFQTTYEAFEKEFRAYVDSRTYTATAINFEKELDFDSEMQVIPISEGEAQAYLGDLLLHTNRLVEAETRLQQAITLAPDLTMAQASFAMLRVRQGRFDDAREALRKAAAADSQNYLIHYYYAVASGGLMRGGSQIMSGFSSETAELMRKELKRAIELKPDFPASYSLLALVNLVRGEELDESIEILKRALTISKSNQEVPLMLAQLYLHKEDYANARQVLQPIARGTTAGVFRQRAQMLLDQIDLREEQLARYRESQKAEGASEGQRPALRRREREGVVTVVAEDADMSTLISQALRKPREGELRLQGILMSIECGSQGINFKVRVGQALLTFHTDSFERMEIVTFAPNVAGEISCGPRKPENPVVINFVPGKKSQLEGEITSLEFVPGDFVLKP